MANNKTSVRPRNLIRPLIQRLHPYVPGEQPRIKGLIKLNTNENPYPPAPAVLKAVRDSIDERLRLYPNPTAEQLRKKLARFHQCSPENIIVGNGSDELLAMAVRSFVEPASSNTANTRPAQSTVQFFAPSYSLYSVLAEIHGAMSNPVPLKPDFSLPELQTLSSAGWIKNAALTFITTPNAPSGTGYKTSALRQLCAGQGGVVVLDEAYVDFARENALSLALQMSNVLVARTFSKAYSLCFQRIGYFVGPPELIDALQKIRDSYNVNGLGQIAASATLDSLPYYRANFSRIIRTREMLAKRLIRLGFHVFPSQTNFVLVRPPRFEARVWLEKFRRRKVLVRWFNAPNVHDFLRITIGTNSEVEQLLEAAASICSLK